MGVELIDKVRVGRQIADERMAVGEGKGFLFTLLADQAAKIFEAIGASSERFRASAIDGSSRVLLNQSAQAHDGTQRFGSAQLKGALSPLTALLTDDRCSVDPIAAGTDDWSM